MHIELKKFVSDVAQGRGYTKIATWYRQDGKLSSRIASLPKPVVKLRGFRVIHQNNQTGLNEIQKHKSEIFTVTPKCQIKTSRGILGYICIHLLHHNQFLESNILRIGKEFSYREGSRFEKKVVNTPTSSISPLHIAPVNQTKLQKNTLE